MTRSPHQNRRIPSITPSHHPRLILLAAACVALCTCAPAARAHTPAHEEAATPDPRRTSVVEVFQDSKNAVVNISSTQIIEARSPRGFDRLFEEMFDFPVARPRTRHYKRTSVGSGFVLHRAGYIVTNAHVVARTAERKVIFDDNREFDAQVVAIDHERDLAVLKIDPPEPLATLPLGTSADLMVGETVIAIGNPLGYQHTVTAGVVSALDRTLDVGNDLQFTGLIQTDASINPGDSGGPLLNILGRLIGINMAIRGDAQNIGFAIPVDQLRAVMPELLDVERRYRIVTGITVGPGGPCRVIKVAPGGPGDRAGVRTGDLLTAIGDNQVASGIDYHVALIGRRPADKLPLRLTRSDTELTATLTLSPRPKPDGGALLKKRFGLEVEPMSPRMARALRLSNVRGLMVADVDPDSPAGSTGIKPGDVLVRLGRHEVANLDDVGDLLEQLQPGRKIKVVLLRVSGRTLYRLSAELTAH